MSSQKPGTRNQTVPYRACSLHLMFIVVGYVLFVASAVGSSVYLFLHRFHWTSKLEELRKAVLATRDTLDRVYLLAGFVFITFALGIGFYQAGKVWGSYWNGDPKEISSVFVWLYYAGVNVASWRLPRGERRAFVVALLSILGIVLAVLNYLVQIAFPSLHRY